MPACLPPTAPLLSIGLSVAAPQLAVVGSSIAPLAGMSAALPIPLLAVILAGFGSGSFGSGTFGNPGGGGVLTPPLVVAVAAQTSILACP